MIFQEPMTSLNPVLTVGRQITETLRVPRYYRGREAAVRMIRLLRNPTQPLPAWQPPTLDGRAR